MPTFRPEDEDCSTCRHPRSRHIDRASLPGSLEPCDEEGCGCTEFVPSGRPTEFWAAPALRMTLETELRGLRWLAGPQPFATSPDSEVLSELRRVGLARDALGRIELTESGLARLDELER